MSQIRKFSGTIAIIFLILFLAPLILPIAFFISTPAQIPPFLGIFELFWGYRLYDIIFLAFSIFAAILGLSILFRTENPDIPVEESVTEGYAEEEIGEEE